MDIIYSSELFVSEVRRLPSYPLQQYGKCIYHLHFVYTPSLYVSCDSHNKQFLFYLNVINRLVFLLETSCVVSEAGSEYRHII